MEKIYTVLAGSKLYGTSTPMSDRDVKHIVLPPLDDLLLGKRISNTVKKTNTIKNTRNSVDDVDEEFIPIQTFARDFYMGQTYALELAWSIDGTHAEQHVEHVYRDIFPPFIKELRKKFLTSNIKAMMGYVVNQTSMYSLKGERLSAVTELSSILDEVLSGSKIVPADDIANKQLTELHHNPNIIELERKFPKYFKRTEYDIGDGRMASCFSLLEKTLPYTSTIAHTYGVVQRLKNKYGSRAEDASGTGVDWKATMHALRIVDEGLMLLSKKKLVLPYEPRYAEYLLSIKRGEVDYENVKTLLNEKLEQLKDLEKTTTLLPSTPEMNVKFDKWLIVWMYTFYDLQYY